MFVSWCFQTTALLTLHPHPQAPASLDIMDTDAGVREHMLAEADVTSVFHQILDGQHDGLHLRVAAQQGEDTGDDTAQLVFNEEHEDETANSHIRRPKLKH